MRIEEIGVDGGRVRRAVVRADDDEAARLAGGVVARLDAHVGVVDRLLQLGRHHQLLAQLEALLDFQAHGYSLNLSPR